MHASYRKDYSGNPMLIYDLQSDIDRYQTLDQEVISAGYPLLLPLENSTVMVMSITKCSQTI